MDPLLSSVSSLSPAQQARLGERLQTTPAPGALIVALRLQLHAPDLADVVALLSFCRGLGRRLDGAARQELFRDQRKSHQTVARLIADKSRPVSGKIDAIALLWEMSRQPDPDKRLEAARRLLGKDVFIEIHDLGLPKTLLDSVLYRLLEDRLCDSSPAVVRTMLRMLDQLPPRHTVATVAAALRKVSRSRLLLMTDWLAGSREGAEALYLMADGEGTVPAACLETLAHRRADWAIEFCSDGSLSGPSDRKHSAHVVGRLAAVLSRHRTAADDDRIARCLKLVRRQLGDGKRQVRASALFSLAVCDREEGLRQARGFLRSGGAKDVLAAAADVLGTYGDRRDAPLLLQLLKNEHFNVREAAILAIGRFSPERQLRAIADEEEWQAADAAMHAVCKNLGSQPALRALIVRFLGERSLAQPYRMLETILSDSPAFFPEAVLSAVKSRAWETRQAAAIFLNNPAIPEGESLLRTLVKDPAENVRIEAVKSLANIHPELATSLAREALRDAEPALRMWGLDEFRDNPDPALLDTIISLSRDAHPMVRLKALIALAGHDDPRAFGELASSLEDADEDVRKTAREILDEDPSAIPVLSRFQAGEQWKAVEDIRTRWRELGAWANQAGLDLLGYPVVMRHYRQGIGRTAGERISAIEIEVSDSPLTGDHPHSPDVIKGIILHEIGHHVFDVGVRGARTARRIARSAGIGHIFDILRDERLERALKSLRPEWGRYFDRLASYAFTGVKRRITIEEYASLVGRPLEETARDVKSGKLPGQLLPWREPREAEIKETDLFGIPGAVPPGPAFLVCLRCGLDPRLCADPRVARALDLVPAGLKDLTHAQVLEAAQRIAKVIGGDEQYRKQMELFRKRVRSFQRELRKILQALCELAERLERESGREIPARAHLGGDTGAIFAGRPRPTRPVEAKRGQFLNLGKELTFDRLQKEETLPFNPEAHLRLVNRIRPHIRRMRRYLERLGRREVEEPASRRGRRLDLVQARKSPITKSPNLLVSLRRENLPDMYLGILIDRSGSMAGDKLERAKLFGLLLTESARGLRGISGHISAFDDKTFYRLGDFRANSIASLEADNGNNDAGGLLRAAELTLNSGKRNKLLVMISDDSPTECTRPALKMLVKRLTDDCGIVCVHAAVEPAQKSVFPEYIDLSRYDVDEAVARFGRLIIRLALS